MPETSQSYAQDQAFWDKYVKGRPQIPESFYDLITKYHADHGGAFDTAHDIGAGVGVQSPRLAKHFSHVIVSDIVPANVELAEKRLGASSEEGGRYSYRVADIDSSATDLVPGSVDMVFASFAMHFAHYNAAIPAIARQLKPGGTFVALIGTRAILDDERVNAVYKRIWDEGQYVLLRHASDRKERLRTLGNAALGYDSMPLPETQFEKGAVRLAVNARAERWPSLLTEELLGEFYETFGGSAVGPNDQVIFQKEADPDWNFTADFDALKQQLETVPFTLLEPEAFTSMFAEMKEIMDEIKTVNGTWPVRIILATRK